MPRTAITVADITRDTGAAVTFVAFDKTNGMSIDNTTQRVQILIINTDTNEKNIEFSTDKTYDSSGVVLQEKTYTVPLSTGLYLVPPLPNSYFGQDGLNQLNLDLATADDITGLTIAAVTTEVV